jgi:hypothetical protein
MEKPTRTLPNAKHLAFVDKEHVPWRTGPECSRWLSEDL